MEIHFIWVKKISLFNAIYSPNLLSADNNSAAEGAPSQGFLDVPLSERAHI